MDSGHKKSPNRLAGEKSPYLLQHAYNPVDWHPWGEDAFKKAREEEKPVFLSIGYSTCHWCHVMERESFEDEEVADLLNRHFVPIKVDREERPDLDQLYMAACQAVTGQGGWPLTVFLTAEGKPFYAGTYFPKHSRYGVSGLVELLPRLHRAWIEERNKLLQAADELDRAARGEADAGLARPAGDPAEELPAERLFGNAYRQLLSSYDRNHGGFGRAPKFPSPHQLVFLLRHWRRSGKQEALEMVSFTLRAMRRGGIFDQLGYGMHRYSVDQRWLVPHFEKMLYDQASTALAALEAYQAGGDPGLARMAREIFDYVLRELTSPEGAFYSAEDADSEGEEGTFYVWRPEEFEELLGPDEAPLAAAYFGVTEKGNFEKQLSVLHLPRGEGEEAAGALGIPVERLDELAQRARLVLLEARSGRPRPFRDDKVLAAWNGLFIAALARGAVALGDGQYARAASRAADAIMEKLLDGEGRLLRRYRDGEAAIEAFLEDYAFLAWGHLELYRATFESRYLERALALVRAMEDKFYLPGGTLLFSAGGAGAREAPITAEAYDGAMPSGVSAAAMVMLQLGRLLRDKELEKKGESVIRAYLDRLERYPSGHTFLLAALDYAVSPPEEVIIAGPRGSQAVKNLVNAANGAYRPHLNLLFRPTGDGAAEEAILKICPFLAEIDPPPGEEAAAFYCCNLRCLPPETSAEGLAGLLAGSEAGLEKTLRRP